jgi:hypothetical protein
MSRGREGDRLEVGGGDDRQAQGGVREREREREGGGSGVGRAGYAGPEEGVGPAACTKRRKVRGEERWAGGNTWAERRGERV